MKIVLDTEACTGHGRCYSLAPDLFDCDDAGYAELKVDGELTAEQEAPARQAVANCPERAIALAD